MTSKKSFILYADLIHTVGQMPNELKGELFQLILDFVNGRESEPSSLLLKLAFTPIKMQLERDEKKWSGEIETRTRNSKIGNLKRWHPELYAKVSKGEMKLDAALSIAYPESSHPDPPRSTPIPLIPDNVNVTVNDTVTVSVNDSVSGITTQPPAKNFIQEKPQSHENNTKPSQVQGQTVVGPTTKETPSQTEIATTKPLYGRLMADGWIAEIRENEGKRLIITRILKGQHPSATNAHVNALLDGFAGKFDANHEHEKGGSFKDFTREWGWYINDLKKLPEIAENAAKTVQPASKYKTAQQIAEGK